MVAVLLQHHGIGLDFLLEFFGQLTMCPLQASHELRLCFLLGRTSEAVEQFERCQSILAEELGSSPSPATIELYERIVRRRRAGVRLAPKSSPTVELGSHSDLPFVGREEERRDLIDSMETVLGGLGGVVLVEGEPGVGKSRLVTEAIEDAEWRGFQTSWGSCSFGALRPFEPLAQVIDTLSPLRLDQLSAQVAPVWLNEALRLAPGSDSAAVGLTPAGALRPAEESTRMKEALVNTLCALGEITPHLIVIDDVQWADSDTLNVLGQIGSRLAASRILLVLVYRSEEARGDSEVWDTLRDLDRVAGLGRLVLSSLSVFELDEMVRRALGVPKLPSKTAANLHRRTGGNVLFALETLRALRDEGKFDGTDPAEALTRQLGSDSAPVAPRVRSVIDSRMSLLDEEVSSVYELAAVFGDGADVAVLAAAAESPRPSIANAVDQLLHRGLIRERQDGGYSIPHDQVRQVVYERIDPSSRVALHRRVAEAMAEARPDDLDAIGYHFSEGDSPDEAASYLKKAGLRAIHLNGYATAAQHLKSAYGAAEQAGWSRDQRYELLGELESVLSVLGRREAQQDTIERMSSLLGSHSIQRSDIERRRAWLLAHSAAFEEAEKSALRAVRAERRREDLLGQAASLVALGTSIRWSGRPLDAVSHLEEAVAVAHGNDSAKAEALTELGSTLVEIHVSPEAMDYLSQASEIYKRNGDLRGEAEVAGIRGRAFHQTGERDRAAEEFERAIELCEQLGYRHGEGVNQVNLSLLHHMLGRVADALPGYERAARIFADLGNRRGQAMVLANSADARHGLLGEDVRAKADATKAMELFEGIGDPARQAQCLGILSGIAGRDGRWLQARRMLDKSLDLLEGSGNSFIEGQHLRSLALLELHDENLEDALEALDHADELSLESGFDDLAVELLSIRGTVTSAAGDEAGGLEMTLRAVRGIAPGVERPYLVYHRHAGCAAAAGDHVEAQCAALKAGELLEAALEGLSDAEHEHAIERVPEHREIVVAASRLVPERIQVHLPRSGPAGESDQEFIEVTWTVQHPEDDRLESPVDKRRNRVIRLVQESENTGAMATVERLADALGVSESTVRRDLTALRRSGHSVPTKTRSRTAS